MLGPHALESELERALEAAAGDIDWAANLCFRWIVEGAQQQQSLQTFFTCKHFAEPIVTLSCVHRLFGKSVTGASAGADDAGVGPIASCVASTGPGWESLPQACWYLVLQLLDVSSLLHLESSSHWLQCLLTADASEALVWRHRAPDWTSCNYRRVVVCRRALQLSGVCPVCQKVLLEEVSQLKDDQRVCSSARVNDRKLVPCIFGFPSPALVRLGEAGVVTERGTHDELVARDGVYAALVRRQLQTSANQITEAQVDAAAQEVEVEAAIDELTPVRASTPPK